MTAVQPSTADAPADEVPKRSRKRLRGQTEVHFASEAPAADDDTAMKPPKAAKTPAKKSRAAAAKRASSPADKPHSPAFSERAAHAAATIHSFRAQGEGSAPAERPSGTATAGGRRARVAVGSSPDPSKAAAQTSTERSPATAKRNAPHREGHSQVDTSGNPGPRSGRSKSFGRKPAARAAKSASQATPPQASIGRASAKGVASKAADNARLKMLAHSAPQPGAKRRRPSSQQADAGNPAAPGTEAAAALVRAKGSSGKRRQPAAPAPHSGPTADPSLKRRRRETGVAFRCACAHHFLALSCSISRRLAVKRSTDVGSSSAEVPSTQVAVDLRLMQQPAEAAAGRDTAPAQGSR